MINIFDEKKCYEYENGFYLTSDKKRLGNIIAHYELYKKIIDLPGDVIELGVFKGGSLIQFATYRDLLENTNSRKIIGFDIFGTFPMTDKMESDKKFIECWNKEFENEIVTENELYMSLKYKQISNVELVKGNILTTVEDYIKLHPELKIALLHIDVDVYEPAKRGMELLFDRVVRGGCIVFDDYATVEGETKAIDEFLSNKTEYTIHKFPFSHAKPSYIIKQ